MPHGHCVTFVYVDIRVHGPDSVVAADAAGTPITDPRSSVQIYLFQSVVALYVLLGVHAHYICQR